MFNMGDVENSRPVMVSKQIIDFLKEFKPVECSCCNQVTGFVNRTSGQNICPRGQCVESVKKKDCANGSVNGSEHSAGVTNDKENGSGRIDDKSDGVEVSFVSKVDDGVRRKEVPRPKLTVRRSVDCPNSTQGIFRSPTPAPELNDEMRVLALGTRKKDVSDARRRTKYTSDQLKSFNIDAVNGNTEKIPYKLWKSMGHDPENVDGNSEKPGPSNQISDNKVKENILPISNRVEAPLHNLERVDAQAATSVNHSTVPLPPPQVKMPVVDAKREVETSVKPSPPKKNCDMAIDRGAVAAEKMEDRIIIFGPGGKSPKSLKTPAKKTGDDAHAFQQKAASESKCQPTTTSTSSKSKDPILMRYPDIGPTPMSLKNDSLAKLKLNTMPVSPFFLDNSMYYIVHVWSLSSYLVAPSAEEENLYICQNRLDQVFHDERESLKKLGRDPELHEIVISEYEGFLSRGFVAKINGQECNIQYIDFGDSKVVPINNLYEVPDSIMDIPLYTFTLNLIGLEGLQTKGLDYFLEIQKFLTEILRLEMITPLDRSNFTCPGRLSMEKNGTSEDMTAFIFDLLEKSSEDNVLLTPVNGSLCQAPLSSFACVLERHPRLTGMGTERFPLGPLGSNLSQIFIPPVSKKPRFSMENIPKGWIPWGPSRVRLTSVSCHQRKICGIPATYENFMWIEYISKLIEEEVRESDQVKILEHLPKPNEVCFVEWPEKKVMLSALMSDLKGFNQKVAKARIDKVTASYYEGDDKYEEKWFRGVFQYKLSDSTSSECFMFRLLDFGRDIVVLKNGIRQPLVTLIGLPPRSFKYHFVNYFDDELLESDITKLHKVLKPEMTFRIFVLAVVGDNVLAKIIDPSVLCQIRHFEIFSQEYRNAQKTEAIPSLPPPDQFCTL